MSPFRGQTYVNLLYLVLSFPLGVAYFVGIVTGTALAVGLLITWIGPSILLATLKGANALARFEGQLANWLVGVDIPSDTLKNPLKGAFLLPGHGLLSALRKCVMTRSTWTSVILLLGKFVFGIAAFSALVTTSAIALVLLLAPLLYDTNLRLGVHIEDAYTIGPWVIDTFPEAVVVGLCGAGVASIGLTVLNTLAHFHARYTAELLGSVDMS